MKKEKIIVLLIGINIILIGIICSLISKNGNIIKEKQIIKEMSSTTREDELNDKLTQANKSATEYANYIQSCKEIISNAITNQGVETSSDAIVDIMAENIAKIGENKYKEGYENGYNAGYLNRRQSFTVSFSTSFAAKDNGGGGPYSCSISGNIVYNATSASLSLSNISGYNAVTEASGSGSGSCGNLTYGEDNKSFTSTISATVRTTDGGGGSYTHNMSGTITFDATSGILSLSNISMSNTAISKSGTGSNCSNGVTYL